MILEILIVILALAVVHHFWRNRRFYQLANKIPKSPFDNSPLTLLRNTLTGTDAIFNELIKVYGGNAMKRTWLGPVLFVNVADPEDVKLVINSRDCIDKPYFVKFVNLFEGTLFGEIGPWQAHRRVLNPFFTVQGLRSVIPIFNRRVQVLMSELQKKEGKEQFNVFYDMAALTIETILSVMNFNVDSQSPKDKWHKDNFIHNIEELAKLLILRIYNPLLHLGIVFDNLSIGKKSKRLLFECKTFASRLASRARDSFISNSEQKKAPTIIEALIDPKNGFTESEIQDEVATLVMAAQDTSAIASSATLLLLAMHKDKQEKVFDELRRVICSSKDSLYLDIEQLNELEYLEMAINESMRLLPVVPFIFRTNSSEIISSEGYVIPANANLQISVFNIHRNKSSWGKDADEFKPERFEKEKFAKINPYAFLPFAKGSRMCIGWRYAMFLMKIQLANILFNYEIDTRLKFNELTFKINTTLNVIQGYQISIKKRKGQ